MGRQRQIAHSPLPAPPPHLQKVNPNVRQMASLALSSIMSVQKDNLFIQATKRTSSSSACSMSQLEIGESLGLYNHNRKTGHNVPRAVAPAAFKYTFRPLSGAVIL